MKETEFYQKMIDKYAVDDFSVTARACAPVARKGLAWKRVLLPIAASLVLVCGTVLLIPSARAEVFRWFGVQQPANRIADYLGGGEDKREEIPDLDALVATPDPNGGAVTVPIDRTDADAVNSARALAVSALLHENCDVALGDALYDGEEIYQSVRLNGLSGLYLLEQLAGGDLTGVPVDPEGMTGMYEDSELEPYRSGERTMLEYPRGQIFYEMPDGARQIGILALTDAVNPYLEQLADEGLILPDGATSDALCEKLNERNRAYLNENGAVAVARIVPNTEDWAHYWERFTDADGNMTVRVLYRVYVVEEDRADGAHRPATELYTAELGTITVNMTAYRDVPQKEVGRADEAAVVFGPETALISHTKHDYPGGYYNDEVGVDLTFTSYRVSLEGVTMRLDAKRASVSALGIRNLQIKFTFPSSWTWDQREAFKESLVNLKMLINGEEGDWGWSYSPSLSASGALILDHFQFDNMSQEVLSSIKTISFYPIIGGSDRWIPGDADFVAEDGSVVTEVSPVPGEAATVHVGTLNFTYTGNAEPIEYPQYAVTLTVN